jgi:hypothetical protein
LGTRWIYPTYETADYLYTHKYGLDKIGNRRRNGREYMKM